MTIGGAFLTSREIFDNPIWQNIVEFRLFFLIYGQAVFSEEGARVGNINLKRGQWLRSIRNLQKDLEYTENRAIKSYSTATLKRAIDSLVKQNRIETEVSELGTLFTVVNYQLYQGFERYSEGNLERRGNSNETATKQQRNDNNKDIKAMKKKHYAEYVTMTEDEYQKLIDQYGEEFTKRAIEVLDNYKGSHGKKYKSDYRAMLTWVVDRVVEETKKQQQPKTPAVKNAQQTLELLDQLDRGGKDASLRGISGTSDNWLDSE